MLEKICTGCGCLCDDLIVHQDKNNRFSVESNCHHAADWLNRVLDNQQHSPQINGQQCTIDDALTEASRLLNESDSPLIAGFVGCSSQTIREAVRLADYTNAFLDPFSTPADINRSKALAQHGGSTCTLGEVTQRADLILFLNESPVENNPCLLEKLKLDSKTPFLTDGRSSRNIAVLSHNSKKDSTWADSILPLKAQSPTEFLTQLSIAIEELESQSISKEILQLADQIKSAQYPVLIFDSSFGTYEHETCWNALAKCIAVTNQKYRLHTLSISSKQTSHMAESVLAWQTGFPRCLSFASGTPQYDLDRWSADRLLANGEVDLCLIAGEIPQDLLLSTWKNSNNALKIVSIGPSTNNENQSLIDVSIPTGYDGVHTLGTFLRFDHVPLSARKITDSELPSMKQILKSLTNQTTSAIK